MPSLDMYTVLFISSDHEHSDVCTKFRVSFQVDFELRKLHEMYSTFRATNRIRPVKIIQVASRTFELLSNEIIIQNTCTAPTQYKLPRIIRRESLLTFLLKRRFKNGHVDHMSLETIRMFDK